MTAQGNPTKITFIYSHPADPAAVWPKEDGSATPAYRLLDLYFDDYTAASAAAAQAGPLVGATKEHATGGVVIAFAEILDEA
jgi:hypothetical protein